MLHVDPRWGNPPGYRTVRTIEEGFTQSGGFKPVFKDSEKFKGEETQDKINTGAVKEITWADLMREGNVVAGTPSQVTEQLEEVARTLHVGHLMILNQFGSVPHDMAVDNIKKTGAEVLPNLKHLWDDEGWEDNWWPNGLKSPQAPAPIQF
jgi:alkanesulfonate monooxygenase SsuD/methylene tetrahydromethanopterin reductase-like flavin-dependent oxidoreductase (luciferase family)